MQDIKQSTPEELKKVLENRGEAAFHAKQVFSWIYKKNATDFGQMSDLPAGLREYLKTSFYILSLNLIKRIKSFDGTEKFLFALRDRTMIEAVIIPTLKRSTACISTQVGCKFSCHFCASGLLGFKRNLTSGEMIEEVLYLKNNSRDKKITHLVFMGIGEPLDNYDNVIKAIRTINSSYGLNIGVRKITISTCGVIPMIQKLTKEGLQIELSVSLHSADDKIRTGLMPVNKIYPLKDLMITCQDYIEKTGRQITFEYILIRGINSDLPNAQKLSRILKRLGLCKVNLIPCNPVKECNVEPPNKLEILLFRNYLLKAGINVTLRKPRGEDIKAACGQLRLGIEKSK